jgi:cyanophycinase-like exopeptidase
MAVKRKPVLLIAGGRGMVKQRGPDTLIPAALGLAGVEHPTVGYVGAASGDLAVFRAFIGRLLRKAGAGEVRLAPLCGKRADVGKAKKVLERADLVFISGGDVDDGMRVLADTEMIGFLRELYREGKPFFGISAGSIMLAERWVRWRDPKDDASAELFPCLGIAPVLCDTHGEGDGWEELQALQRLSPPGSVSYGITSGAALAVNPDGTVRALGKEIHRFGRKGRNAVRLDDLKVEAP